MRSLILVGALSLLSGAVAAQGTKVKEASPGLLAQAQISADSALKVALARAPNARMKSGEIEKESGKLVYSFDLTVKGKGGVEEVQVDALTGVFVSQEHESAEQEAEESRKEAEKPPAKP